MTQITISSGDVYLYTWDGDGRQVTGEWPGAAMANYGQLLFVVFP